MSRQLPLWLLQLDLAPYAAKLIQRGWEQGRTEKAVQEYREFLFDAAINDDDVSPTKDVDDVWHLHILDTRRYYADCKRLFGRMIHHIPSETTCHREGKLATCHRHIQERATCGKQVQVLPASALSHM